MNRDSNPRTELFPIELVKVNVATGLVKGSKSCSLQCSYGLFSGDSGQARHLDCDTRYLRVMPLPQEGKFFLDGSEVESDGVSDISQGLLLGFSLTDAARKHRTSYRPTPFFIVFQDNCVVHHLLPCSAYKYTVISSNFDEISQTPCKRTVHKQGTMGQIEKNGNQR